MDPSYQQRLRDEVIYLHSLWHQGPPTQNPTGNPNPRPNNPSRNHLHVTNSTPFKTKSTKTKPKTQPVPGKEWPVNPTPPPKPTGWPELKPHSHPPTRPVLLPIECQPQHKALQSCREFFTDLDSDEEESSENDDVFEEGNEDYLMGSTATTTTNDDTTNYEQSEEFNFLLKLFVQDNELRGFYERNYESEDKEFCCLVCGGVGEKVGKRFKGCVGLIQHSISVAKTKRKRAHRAFSHVICRVLGWDVDRWPMIVSKGEPLSRSLANSCQTQGEHKGNPDGNKDDSVVVVDSNVDSVDAIIGETVVKDSESIVNESPLSEGDGNKHVENIDNGVSSSEENKEEVTGCQGSLPSLGIQWPCGWPTLNSETASVTHADSSSIALGWSTSKPQKTSMTRLVSAEEQVRFAAFQLQQKVLEACREFFVNATGSDSDEDDNEDEDKDDLMDEDGLEECNEFKFFLRVFTENSELRSYYENNHEGGEFCCLVCGGIGKKAWKRFKGCVGLLQHSTAILKTKKKRAHRALGQVICKVLGWEIDRLPTIVSKGETLSCSLAMLSELLQGEPKGSAEGNENDSVVVKNIVGSMDGNNGGLIKKGASGVNMNNGELMVCENSLKGDVADNHVKNLDSGVSGMEADKDGAVDCQGPLKKDDSGIEADNIQGRTVGIDVPKEDGTHQS